MSARRAQGSDYLLVTKQGGRCLSSRRCGQPGLQLHGILHAGSRDPGVPGAVRIHVVPEDARSLWPRDEEMWLREEKLPLTPNRQAAWIQELVRTGLIAGEEVMGHR